MTPTPTKPESVASSSDKSDNRSRFGRQIEEAFEAASKLAGSNLPPADFYQQFLNRTLSAIDAPAGAVWLRTPQGFLQIACQKDLDKVGLDARRGGRECHTEVLRQVFLNAPPRPLMLAPNERMAPNPAGPPAAPPGAGPQAPAANLTDYFALFAPIVTPDKQALGVLEVFQDPSHDPRSYPTYLNYSYQMAGYASQYHQFSNARAASGVERTFAQVEQFARLVHTTLNPTEVAYHVANEGRKLCEADRLCVGVRYARKKVTVEAVSGADVVEKASTHVRRLRDLMSAVLQWGEPLTFKGEKDAGLPPDVSHALDEYLAESQPKLLVVQPIRDEREKDQSKPARSVLVMESFNPPEDASPLIQRLEVVAKHAAPALYNAAELKRVPLKFLWWPLARVQEGLGGKTRFYMAGGAVALAALTAALVLVPAPLRMDAKGQLLPVEIGKVYAPKEGQVRRLLVRPGEKVKPDAPAVELFDPQLQAEVVSLNLKVEQARAKLGGLELAREELLPEEQKTSNRIQKLQANAELNSAAAQLADLNATFNAGRGRPGEFLALTKKFGPGQNAPADARWTVLNDDRSREALVGKTVRTSEELVRVGYIEGPWQVELKIPQRNVGQIARAFATPGKHKEDAAGRKYLDVDILLASMPDAKYLARLYQSDLAAEALPNKDEHDENEPVMTAYAKLNLDDIPRDKWIDPGQFTTGLEVRTRIRCGDHALGYSLFHGVWEWFYEKVVFFF